MKTILLTLFFFSPLHLLCQETNITIRINGPKKEPVPYASITVINRLDSADRQTKVADSTGAARFSLSKNKQFSVLASAVNYLPVEKGISTNGVQSVFTFVAEPAGKTLSTAVVVSRKPLMRQEDDKTIVDPENLVATSTSGYEVIEKTPGLFVDQDGNIYISSLTPATVQINGRDMRMSAEDVATLLKSLPPNAIASIEVVRTPSAKYDAASSGGVVNVVLKKGVKLGLTGSINGGFQQGTYGNQFVGFNLNNNDGRKTSYINMNYSRRKSYEQINTRRLFGSNADTTLDQDAYTIYPANVYYLGYGISIGLTPKWNFAYDGNATLNDYNNVTENVSDIRKLSASQLLSRNYNNTGNNGSTLNLDQAFSLDLKLDSLGSKWENDFSYTWSHNEYDQRFSNTYTHPVSYTSAGNGNVNSNRHFFLLQSDLKKKLPKKLTLEMGGKTTVQVFKNESNYFTNTGVTNISKDSSRSNTFDYRENINAAYVQGSKTFGKNVVLKAGVRLENTNMKGHQVFPRDTTFDLHRTDLFPYVYLSKDLLKIAGYSLRGYLVYRRTIARPFYEQLNPFPRYIDQYLSQTGNPSLRPQFTQNFEANVSVDERPILAVGLNDTKDIFSIVTYQSDTNQSVAYRTYDNLGKNKEWYLRGLGALPPGGRYFFVLGAQYNHNFYDGVYEGQPLQFKKGTWTFFTYQTFRVDKRSTITLNGFVRLRGQQQLYEIEPFGALNASINRKFLKDKLIATVSVNDMFFTNRNDFILKQGSVNVTGLRVSDTRRFGINLRYNFGLRKREESNNMFGTEPPVTN
ncbi:MAG: outer membrane beta-barrel protein [Chitinophagaceae bacterium]|nr:outer membrane beta-barrel protein [Chitinophagaceae bacterium]